MNSFAFKDPGNNILRQEKEDDLVAVDLGGEDSVGVDEGVPLEVWNGLAGKWQRIRAKETVEKLGAASEDEVAAKEDPQVEEEPIAKE